MANHIITTADEPVVFSSPWKSVTVAAGDTVEIEDGTYTSLIKFDDSIVGTEASPIVVTNTGGQVNSTLSTGSWSFLVDGSEWVEFNFDGDDGTSYGLKLVNRFKIHAGVGISLNHADISNANGIGIHVAQQDANKSTEITDIAIEDCYIHDCDGEAVYAGNTRSSSPASDEYILRRVYQRRLTVADCYEGPGINSCHDWEIVDCVVTDTDPHDDSAHNAGISAGKGANGPGKVCRNRIIGCTGYGIAVNVSDNVEQSGTIIEISHNEIHSVGTETLAGVARNNGIHVSSAIPTINIHHNTVTKVGNGTDGHGIRLADPQAFAYDNICVDIQDDGISLSGSVPSGNAHHNLSNKTAQSLDGVAHTESSILFANYAADDFELSAGSPAIGESSTGDDVGANQFSSGGGGGSPTTINLTVTGSSDDARQISSGGVNITDTGSTINDADEYFGYRFQNVTIPQGSTITVATLSIYVANTANDDPDVIITAEGIDTSPAFVATSSNISDRTDTTANIIWQDTAIGTGYNSPPDISTVIQEIVDRAGWVSGNDLSVILRQPTATGALRSEMVDKGTGFAAKLDITYTSAAGTEEIILRIRDLDTISADLRNFENMVAVIQGLDTISADLRDIQQLAISISDLDTVSADITNIQPLTVVIQDLPFVTAPAQNLNTVIQDGFDTVSADLSAINELSISVFDIDTMSLNITRRHNREIVISDMDMMLLDLSSNALIESNMVDMDTMSLSMETFDNVAIFISDMDYISADLQISTTVFMSISISDMDTMGLSLDTIGGTQQLVTSIFDMDTMALNLSIIGGTEQLSILITDIDTMHAIITTAMLYTQRFTGNKKSKLFISKRED